MGFSQRAIESGPFRVHTGTTWAQPCLAAVDGVHHYRRPVVSVSVANDAQERLEKSLGAELERLRKIEAAARPVLDALDREFYCAYAEERGALRAALEASRDV